MTEDFYFNVAEKLYEGYKGILGEAATGVARRNAEAEIDDKGNMTDFNGGKEELAEFINDFKDTIGEVAIRTGKNQIQDLENLDQEKLPQILRGDN